MTSTLQVKLRGIFKADELPEKLTNPAGDILTQVITAINNFFQHIIGFFNQEFPPETREEQIQQWLNVAAPYLIAAAVLIVCLCCCRCLFACIYAILVRCFNIVCWFFRCLGRCVCSFFRCLGRCLCCGRGTRMMKAPGRPSMRLPRASFEANPRGYFRGLRGQPNNFVY